MEKIKRSDLVKAAREINEILGLDPPIDVKAKSEVLKKKLIEAAGLLEEGDEISKDTQVILDSLTDAKKLEPEEEWKERVDAGEEWKEREDAGEEEDTVEKSPVSTKEPERKKVKGVPKREGSLAELADQLMERKVDLDTLITKVTKEAENRGLKSMATPGAVKAHIRYRASKGFAPAQNYTL